MSDLSVLFSDVERVMAEHQSRIERAEDTDLAGLEKQIGTLCEHVASLPMPEQVQHVERLTALLEGLNQLGESLRQQMGEVKDLPKHKNANVAYSKADSRDNFGKRDKKDG